MQPGQDGIRQWQDSAPMWLKHQDVIKEMFAPVTQALIVEGNIGSGQSVLDIATGAGEPALTIAPLLGAQGKIFGIDPVPEMINAARRAAQRDGFANARFEVAPAERLPFPSETFDAVVNRFGIMFVPAPVAAVREMLRVLRPGGKLALAAWHLHERNPYSWTLSQVIEKYIDSQPPAPDAAEQFRFASPGKLRDIVLDADAASVSERLLKFTIQATVKAEDFVAMRCEMNQKLDALSPEQLTELKHEALEAFRQYETEGGMSFPAEVLIVSGSKRLPA